MLAKEKRLPIKVKIEKGKVFSTPLFSLKIGKNNEEKSRLAFVVSKKVSQNAAKRNRIKRQFRSILEKEYNRLEPGFDFLFRIKKEALELKKEDIAKTILEMLKKEKLIK